jgi:hypothetical protein
VRSRALSIAQWIQTKGRHTREGGALEDLVDELIVESLFAERRAHSKDPLLRSCLFPTGNGKPIAAALYERGASG